MLPVQSINAASPRSLASVSYAAQSSSQAIGAISESLRKVHNSNACQPDNCALPSLAGPYRPRTTSLDEASTRRAHSASPRLYRPYKSACIAARLPQRQPGALCRFEEQMDQAISYLNMHKQPDSAMLKGDMATMPDFAAIKNTQNPGLNLFIADSVMSLLGLIETMPQKFHLRCVLKHAEGSHHMYVDIQRTATGPLSFIVLDSTDIDKHFSVVTILFRLITKLREEPRYCESRIMCFSTNVQKSDSDCLIFCVDFALKAHQHQCEFDRLHTSNRDRLPGDNTQDEEYFVAPLDALPFAIFEHAQSKTSLLHTLDTTNSRLVGQIQKMIAQQEIRTTVRGKTCYPTSIEYRRQQFLSHAITALSESD